MRAAETYTRRPSRVGDPSGRRFADAMQFHWAWRCQNESVSLSFRRALCCADRLANCPYGDEPERERESVLRPFSMTSRQRKLKTRIRCIRQFSTRPGSGMKSLHNFIASGMQASRCSGVASVPWLNATEVVILKAALRKTAPMANRMTRRLDTSRIGDLKTISQAVNESRRDLHSATLTRRRSYWTGLTAGASDERLRTVSVMSVSRLDCSLGIDRMLAQVLARRGAEKNNVKLGSRTFSNARTPVH
jgi:hypothetical protein